MPPRETLEDKPSGVTAMRKRLLPLILGVLILAAAAPALWRLWSDRPGALQDDGPLAPALEELLSESAVADASQASPFFASLRALAREHGLEPDAYLPQGIVSPDEGRAVKVRADGRVYAVLILRGWDHFIPGDDTEYLVLLDRDGRPLDRLSCSVNDRLTRWSGTGGTLLTEVPIVPEWDGARLVIRYVPEPGGSVSGNWEHGIEHAGDVSHWGWDGPTDWGRRGLCRVAIRDGKFVVLFPRLPEAARAFRPHQHVRGE